MENRQTRANARGSFTTTIFGDSGQRLRFCIAAAFGLALDLLVFSFASNELELGPTPAAATGFVVALAAVYLVNRHWTAGPGATDLTDGFAVGEDGSLVADLHSAAVASPHGTPGLAIGAGGEGAVERAPGRVDGQPGTFERAGRHLSFLAVVARLVLAAIAFNRRRLVLFVAVGGLCLLVQLWILEGLRSFGTAAFVADAVAFFLSAQLNFLLSYRLTWGDSARARGAALLRKWLAFLAVATASALVNAAVYVVFEPLLGVVPALLVAGGVSMIGTYLLNDQLVFTPDRRRALPARVNGSLDSIAWFLPAHNEAENLTVLTEKVLAYLNSLGFPATVIIVDDGSSDDTAEVCRELAAEHPQVRIATHEVNRGYGAALRTGLQSGLETGHALIGFCDADRQFEIESVGPMLDAIADADLVLGYRLKRADSWDRRLKGQFWQSLNRLVLPIRARDFDCGLKLFRREVVVQLLPILRGEYATISPEIIFRAQQAGFAAVEVPVEHHPRTAGEQSGSDEKVVLGSLLSLAQLIREEQLVREEM